jgi:hypothetical protein
LGLASVVAQPRQNRLSIDHALTGEQAERTDVATALLAFQLNPSTSITLNDQSVKPTETLTIDGQRALVIPLATGTVEGRYRQVQRALDQAAEEPSN